MLTTQTEDVLRFPFGASTFSAESQVILPPAQQVQVRGGPLLNPVVLSVEQTEEGQILVADELLSSYGVGDDINEAVDEFMEMMLDYYQELAESQEQLSSFLRAQLRILKYYLGSAH